MIGVNIVTLNMDQVKDVLERHLKDDILKDGDFTVTGVSLDYQAQVFKVTMGPKENAEG